MWQVWIFFKSLIDSLGKDGYKTSTLMYNNVRPMSRIQMDLQGLYLLDCL